MQSTRAERAPDGVADAPTATRQETIRIVGPLIYVGVALGFMLSGTSGVINGIGELFKVSAGQLQWVSSVQLLATVVLVPVLARMGDIFGHRRVLWIALTLTAIGSVLVAAAPSFGVLLVGRALQAGIAVLFGLGAPILRDRLPMERGHTAIAAITGAMLIGSAVGLIVASRVATGPGTGGVRATLWIAAGVTALAVPISLITPDSRTRAKVTVDGAGAVVLAIGLIALMLGLKQAPTDGWGHPTTLLYLIVGVGVLSAWVVQERRTAQPLIDVRRLSNRRILPIYLISLAFGVAAFGAQTAAITFMGTPRAQLGYGLSLSISTIALLLVPCCVAAFVAAMAASRIAARLGDRWAFGIGGVLLTAGFALAVGWHDKTWQVVGETIVQFAGIGVIQSMIPAVLSSAAPETERGSATGVGDALKGLGGGLSTAAFATLESSLVIAHTTVPTVTAYEWVWGICAVLSAVILAMVAFLPVVRRVSVASVDSQIAEQTMRFKQASL